MDDDDDAARFIASESFREAVRIAFNAAVAEALIADTIKSADRREMLCRNAKPCPACFTEQVQLVDYFVVPAQWKCRHCKHRFTHEPAT